MRIEDIHNFFTLRQITSNPFEIIRFRKNRNIENLLEVQFLNGPPVYLRGGTRDFHLFHRIYLRDEYRVNPRLFRGTRKVGHLRECKKTSETKK